MVSSTVQLLNFDGSVLQIVISCYYNNDIKHYNPSNIFRARDWSRHVT